MNAVALYGYVARAVGVYGYRAAVACQLAVVVVDVVYGVAADNAVAGIVARGVGVGVVPSGGVYGDVGAAVNLVAADFEPVHVAVHRYGLGGARNAVVYAVVLDGNVPQGLRRIAEYEYGVRAGVGVARGLVAYVVDVVAAQGYAGCPALNGYAVHLAPGLGGDEGAY